MSTSKRSDPMDPFAQVEKLIEQFKVPGVDLDAIIESRRKDMTAALAAAQTTATAMQEIASKQAQILMQALKAAQENASALAQGGGGAIDPAKQAELTRKAYEKAIADIKAVAEIAQTAQTSAMAAITERVQENMQELSRLFTSK